MSMMATNMSQDKKPHTLFFAAVVTLHRTKVTLLFALPPKDAITKYT